MEYDLNTLILSATDSDIEKAAAIIRDGGLVAFPTETVYGLGADAFNEEAVKKIYEAKGRPQDNPTIVHICDISELEKLTDDITDDIKKMAEAFWPGPMTMVMWKKRSIPMATTGGLNTVGVRLPSEEIARELIRKAGSPIAAPSANISGAPSPTKAEHVIKDMNGRIDAVICGTACKHGIESTVIDMTADPPVILRPGVVTAEMAGLTLGKEVRIDPAVNQKIDGEFIPKAPGMKYKHYAPEAEVTVFMGAKPKVRKTMDEAASLLQSKGKSVAVIEFHDAETAARELFDKLRKADDEGMEYVYIAAIPEEGIGLAVMNRMLKAAGYNIVTC